MEKSKTKFISTIGQSVQKLRGKLRQEKGSEGLLIVHPPEE